jgi:hypothetical protein
MRRPASPRSAAANANANITTTATATGDVVTSPPRQRPRTSPRQRRPDAATAAATAAGTASGTGGGVDRSGSMHSHSSSGEVQQVDVATAVVTHHHHHEPLRHEPLRHELLRREPFDTGSASSSRHSVRDGATAATATDVSRGDAPIGSESLPQPPPPGVLSLTSHNRYSSGSGNGSSSTTTGDAAGTATATAAGTGTGATDSSGLDGLGLHARTRLTRMTSDSEELYVCPRAMPVLQRGGATGDTYVASSDSLEYDAAAASAAAAASSKTVVAGGNSSPRVGSTGLHKRAASSRDGIARSDAHKHLQLHHSKCLLCAFSERAILDSVRV